MQLKRILAIFLAAALILSAFTVSVGAESLNVFEVGVAAETTTPVSSSPVIYNAGEDVKVTISAVQNTGIDYLRLKVSYEPEALEYVGYTTNELFGVNNLETIQNKNGYLLFTAVLNEVSSATGDMFTINFKTKDSFCGETEVVAQLSNNDESNCMITDPDLVTVVPFVGDSTSFEIHKIDTANGVVTEPTCTEQGYTTYSCANCDMAVIGNYVAANGHTEAEAVEENRVEADCTNNGSYDMVVYCSVCNAELSRESFVIDSHGHSPLDAVEENRVEATCTNNGSYDMVVYCSVCNAELSREKTVLDALGHDTIPHDSKEPTCTAIGWDAYVTCSRCDYTTYNELAVLGHDYNAVVTAPTCTEQGYTTHTCSRCDSEYVDTYVEATGHSYVDKIVYPTISDKGYTLHTCEICSDSYKDNYVDDLASTDNLFPDTDITAWYYEAVNYTVSTGIMSGYGNGNFGPSDSIQRQDFLVMLARYDGVDLSQYTGRSRFTDVQTGSYYAAAVNWGADKGIVSGYQGGTVFGVGDVITREQLVTFLYRYASYKGIDVSYSNSIRVEAKDKYKDYSQVSDWSLDCVMWALDKHVISGANNGTEILPQGNAERCQVAQIMYNIFNNNVF